MFSLHLKLPNRSGFLGDGGGDGEEGVALFDQFACPPVVLGSAKNASCGVASCSCELPKLENETS